MLEGLSAKGNQYSNQPILEQQDSIDSDNINDSPHKKLAPVRFSRKTLANLCPGHILNQGVLFSSHPSLLQYQLKAVGVKNGSKSSHLNVDKSDRQSRLSSSVLGSRLKGHSNNLEKIDLDDCAVLLYISKEGFETTLQRVNNN